MNIFILSTNPILAAQAHCDQHLHKMILESAQLLSTAACHHFPDIKHHVYKPAYPNHPCTKWICESYDNMAYVITLASELENIRFSLGYPTHSSADIVRTIQSRMSHLQIVEPENFAEAMYPHIKIRNDLTTVEKYQLYYRKKHMQWVLDKGAGMSYKGRPTPSFMSDLISQ